mmetsp:Transcript_529/g.1814  ORF Transcript_529/g.1814 Transcript_529/m.1814 type:complete len:510 (+) Transcript_529:135-1664(+)
MPSARGRCEEGRSSEGHRTPGTARLLYSHAAALLASPVAAWRGSQGRQEVGLSRRVTTASGRVERRGGAALQGRDHGSSRCKRPDAVAGALLLGLRSGLRRGPPAAGLRSALERVEAVVSGVRPSATNVAEALRRPQGRQDLRFDERDLAWKTLLLHLPPYRRRVPNHSRDVLLALINLEHYEEGVGCLIEEAFVAAEVRPPKGTAVGAEVVGLPLLLASRKRRLQGDTGRAIDEEGAEAFRRTHVARGVEDELHAIDSSSAEDRAADVLPVGKVQRQRGCLLEQPLSAPDHASLHALHLLPHCWQHPVVDVAVAGERALKWTPTSATAWPPAPPVVVRQRRGWCRVLAHDLQQLDTDPQGVAFRADLVPHGTQAPGPMCGVGAVGLLDCRALAADEESASDVHALVAPEVHSTVCSANAVGCGVAREAPELELQVPRAGRVEPRRAPGRVAIGADVGAHLQRLRGRRDEPLHPARRRVPHLADAVREGGRASVQRCQVVLRGLPKVSQ